MSESSGEYYPVAFERIDGKDTLTWLRGQLWYNGQIVMWGGSSFGQTQYVLMNDLTGDIKTYFIQISSSSFYDMFFPGDAFSLESALYWALKKVMEGKTGTCGCLI